MWDFPTACPAALIDAYINGMDPRHQVEDLIKDIYSVRYVVLIKACVPLYLEILGLA